MPLGKIHLNGLNDLTKVGSVLSKDFREPSIFDLEEIQCPPNKYRDYILKCLNKTNLNYQKPNCASEESCNEFRNLADHSNQQLNTLFNSNENINSILPVTLSKNFQINEKMPEESFFPKFDESSRNFELDNCNGYGKVCLVYRNTNKQGNNFSEQNTEIWFLDRSLQWYYLTSSFKSYYRLLIAHLGLPQWQTLFTDYGLPPFLYVILFYFRSIFGLFLI